MDAATRRRLADLLPRLASDHVGEVTATAAAIIRVLRSAGMDLYDLAAIVAGSTIPEEHPERDAWPDWKIQVETALRLQLWRTDWERDFLHGLRKWAGDPTEKQHSVLERIYTRGS